MKYLYHILFTSSAVMCWNAPQVAPVDIEAGEANYHDDKPPWQPTKNISSDDNSVKKLGVTGRNTVLSMLLRLLSVLSIPFTLNPFSRTAYV